MNKLTKAFSDVLTSILEETATEESLRDLRDSDDAADRSTFWRLAGNRVPKMIEAKVENIVTARIIDLSSNREGNSGSAKD